MSDYTQTPNYGLLKPIVNADNDVWGDHWNLNADTLDNLIYTIQTTATVKSWNGRTGAVALTNADVIAALPSSASAPIADGIASAGIAATWSRGDHVHPTDPSRAPLASPSFTGNPTAPTPAPGDADTSIATTAFVQTALGGVPGGAVINPTPPAGNPGALWWDSTGGQLYVRYDDGTSQQWVTAANMEGLANAATKQDVAATQNNVGRNLLHNPLFAVQQRGAGPFTVTNTNTADRWVMPFGDANDSNSVTVAFCFDADRTAIGDEAAQFCLQSVFAGGAAATSFVMLGQRIENVQRLSGKTVTVSFWAKATSGTPRIGIGFQQNFGSGGSPSATVLGNIGVTPALTSAFKRYSFTAALPSIIGKALGSNPGTHFSDLDFWLSCPSASQYYAVAGGIGQQSGTVNIWGVQLEIGSTATPLEKPDPRYDLANCQRFCSLLLNVILGGYSPAPAAVIWSSVTLPVPMRAAPTASVSPVGSSGATLAANATSNSVLQLVVNTSITGNAWATANFLLSADL